MVCEKNGINSLDRQTKKELTIAVITGLVVGAFVGFVIGYTIGYTIGAQQWT